VPILHIEENSFRFALQMDLDGPGVRLPGHRLCEQRFAPVGGHQRQYRIIGIRRFASKIDARTKWFSQTSREESDVDMRRLRTTVGVGNSAGLHRLKDTYAVCVRFQAAESGEVFI